MNKQTVAVFMLIAFAAVVKSQPVSRDEALYPDEVNTELNNIGDVSKREASNGEQTLNADQAVGDLNQFGDVPTGDESKTRTRGKRCLGWLWQLLGFNQQCQQTVIHYNIGNGHHNQNTVYLYPANPNTVYLYPANPNTVYLYPVIYY